MSHIEISPDEPFASPATLLETLLNCHRRTRQFCALALHLEGGGAVGQVAAAAQALERYFSIDLPLHFADEDVSLVPRLLVCSTSAAFHFDLDEMEEEHEEIERRLEWLLPRWRMAGRSPEQFRTHQDVTDHVHNLAALFDRHIDLEERYIYSRIDEVLHGAEQAAIRREMANRRR